MSVIYRQKSKYYNKSNYYLSSWNIHDPYGSSLVDYSFTVSDGLIGSTSFSFNDRVVSKSKLPDPLKPSDLLKFLSKKVKRGSLTHQLGFIEAIEQLYNISDLNSRSYNQLKMIIAEIDRIFEHCTWLMELLRNSGLKPLSNEVSAFKFKVRELLELISGIKKSKITKCMDVGILKHRHEDIKFDKIKELIYELVFSYTDIKSKIIFNTHLKDLYFGIGLLMTNDAERVNTVGFVARASGLGYDLRVQDPYWDYNSIKNFRLAVSYDQDIFGILKVVVNEVQESLTIVSRCLDSITPFEPENNLEKIKIDQEGHFSIRLEAPSGPTFYHIECSSDMIIKGFGMSTSSLTNLHSLESRLADQPVEHSARIIHAYNLTYFGLVSK